MDIETKLLGLIGHPVEHSLSPEMHNAIFEKLKINAFYVKLDVKKEALESTIECFKELKIAGLNVTIPHKVEVIKYLDDLSKEAKLIGAVNTIRFGEKLIGYNTDGVGCVRALEEAGERVKGKHILILGAGGAARAIAFQSALNKAELSISNRESEAYMAEVLSKDVEKKLSRKVEVVKFEINTIKDKLREVDILINATPVGMHPNIDESVIPAEIIPKGVVVMDIVYNPIETKLLKDAKRKGCETVDGVGMFVYQGAESEKIWLKVDAPVKLMREVVEKKLKSK